MEKNQSSKNIIKRIYSHLDSKRKRDFFVLLFLSILSSFLESISIAILIPFISIFISPDTYLIKDSLKFFLDIFNINNSDDLFRTVSFLFIVIVILSSFIKIKFVNLSNKFSNNINSDFKIKIFEFFLKQNFSYFIAQGSSTIMNTFLVKSKSISLTTLSSINILIRKHISYISNCFLILISIFFDRIFSI